MIKRDLDGIDHPSQDTSYRFPQDFLLRKKGFKIHSRKKNKESVWERCGKLYDFSEALALVVMEEKRNKR